MTSSDQKTGKPVAAKPASAVRASKPAVAAKPAAAVPAVAKPTPVAKAAAPTAAKPPVVKSAPAKPAAVEPAIAKAPVAEAPVAKPAAPAPVEIAAPKPAPEAEPVAALPIEKFPEKSPAPVAPVVEAATAALSDKPVSKPVVEAPVSSSSVPPKASTIPPIPLFMVPHMSTQTFKGYEDFAAFGKANLEAFVQANTLFAKGIEELSKEVVSLAQSSLESSTAATKAIFAAKTLKDVIELQTDFAKTSFEKLVANSTKLGELTVKLATDSAAPIGARVTAASEKALKPAA